MSVAKTFRLAAIQLAVQAEKQVNLARAIDKIDEAATQLAQIVVLPECFNSPYGTNFFPEFAEEVPDGPTCQVLKKAAIKNEIYLVGGSIPEKHNDRLYNTSTVWSPEGKLLAKYRKMHLFDIDIPGKITFCESKVLSPGSDFATFETNFGAKVGIGICYDIRFPDLAQIYAREFGCNLLIYPGAFNMTTGPAHWELLTRGRAVDNQVYVASVSPARDETAGYVAWGHSTVVNPWGEVLARASSGEETIYVDIDLDQFNEVRQQIPLVNQRRHDVYKTTKLQ